MPTYERGISKKIVDSLADSKGRTMSRKFISALLAGAAIVALAANSTGALAADTQPASGQQVAQSAPPPSANTGDLEEIVVTARRREENLQSVPITIQALTGDDLIKNNIQTTSDLTHLIPALTSNQVSRDEQVFSVRGQGAGPAGSGAYPGVQVYFNEVPITSAPAKALGPGGGAGPGLFFDLDNVQVLEGPQGTLFGRNSTGGAILFTSKKPTNDYEGFVQTQFGNYGDKEVIAAINIPIIEDKVLLRLSGSRATRNGFTEQLGTGKDLDDRDYWAGRAELTIRPTEDIENTTVIDDFYSHTNGGSVIFDNFNPNGTLGAFYNTPGYYVWQFGGLHAQLAAASNYPPYQAELTAITNYLASHLGVTLSGYPSGSMTRILALQQALGIRQSVGGFTNLNTGPLDETTNYGVSNTTTWNITDDITVKNIFGFRQLKNLDRQDESGIGLPILGIITPNGLAYDVHQFTDEFQVQGKSFDEKLNWILGTFWYYNSNGGTQLQDSLVSLPGSVQNSFLVTQPIVSYINNNQDHSVAGFGQTTYDFGGLSDALAGLKLTTGYRYTWDFRSSTVESVNNTFAGVPGSCTGATTAAGQLPPSPANGNCVQAQDGAFHAGEYDLSLDYQADPDLLYYITSRRGYKSGGYNVALALYNPSEVTYHPEYVTDAEIGVKTQGSVFGMKTRFNVDYYHDWYENPQQQDLILAGTSTYLQATLNAGSGQVDGLEFNATVLPTKETEVDFNYAYAYGVLSTVPVSVPSQPTVGAPYAHEVRMGQLPQNKLSLTGRYHLPIPDTMGDLVFTTNYNYTSHYFTLQNADQEPGNRVDGFGLLNLSLDWSDVDGRPIDISLFGTNVLNRAYKAGDFTVYKLIGYDAAIYNEPAMYGVKLKFRWGPGIPGLFDKS